MKSAVKEKWIEALRSDAYEQAQGHLWMDSHPKPQACLLGVLVDLAVKEGIVDHREPIWDQSEFGPVPNGVPEWAGLDIETMNYIVDLNDDDKITFAEFADLLASVEDGTVEPTITERYISSYEDEDEFV